MKIKRKKDVEKGEEHKLYLNDLPLETASNDRFESQQVAEILKDSITETPLPLHISLLGKWGSGKTTVIKMLNNLFKEEKEEKYDLKVISVWKFADDSPSLHRKIVREVQRELGVKDSGELDEVTSTTERVKSKGAFSHIHLLRKMGEFKNITISYILIFLLLLLIQFLIPIGFQMFANSTVLLMIISFIAFVLGGNNYQLTTAIQTQKASIPLDHNEQYENRFKNVIDNYLGKNNDKKLILVFDDLDRLPPKQLFGALNTIKTFLNSDRCAFIIPCDESVLKEELKEAFSKKEMKSFEVSEYLNKTFDLTVRLPILEKTNMNNYAISLVENYNILWIKENEQLYKEILFILIHSSVLTPRHVKKIINAFSADWELAKKRDNKNVTGKVLTASPEQLAVFTVLRSDFSDFYTLMVEEPFLIWHIINGDAEKQELDIINFNDLQAFLSRVEEQVPEDPRPFIYFNNQLLNPLTGKRKLEEIKQLIINGQQEEFKNNVDSISKDELGLVLRSVLLDVSSKAETKNVFSILFDNPSIPDVLDVEDTKRLSDLIKKNIEVIINYNLENALQVFSIVFDEHSNVWSSFQELIVSNEKTHSEILDAHISKPDLVNNLNLDGLYQLYNENTINIGLDKGDIYYIPDIINNLPELHPLLNNMNWYDSLVTSLDYLLDEEESDNEDETNEEDLDVSAKQIIGFNLSGWLKNVIELSDQIIKTSQLNHILDSISKIYNDEETEALEGTVNSWIDLYKKNGDPQDLKIFLQLFTEHYSRHISDEEFLNIGNLLNDEYYEEIEEELLKLLEVAQQNLNVNVLEQFLNKIKNKKPVLNFCLDNFKFEKDENNGLYADIIISREESLAEDNLDDIIQKANNSIFDPNSDGSHPLFLKMIRESKIIHNAAENYKDNWFNTSDRLFWFKWNPEDNNFPYKLDIFYELNPNFSPLIDDMETVVENQPNNLGRYQFRDNWEAFLNRAFEFLINKCKNEEIWEETLQKLHDADQNDTDSIFNHLNKDIISDFVNEVPKIISLDNSEVNDIIFDYALPGNPTHYRHILSRWNFFSPDERINFTQQISEDQVMLLVDKVEKDPDLKHIDEVGEYELSKEERASLVKNIIKNTDSSLLKHWMSETLDLLNEKGNIYWRIKAIDIILQERGDISPPEINEIKPLLKFRDQRTRIALMVIISLYPKRYKHKSEFKQMRREILLMEEDDNLKELVREAKSKFGWRNNVLV